MTGGPPTLRTPARVWGQFGQRRRKKQWGQEMASSPARLGFLPATLGGGPDTWGTPQPVLSLCARMAGGIKQTVRY